jgi:CheY-like chemotaxis protein
VVVHLITNAHQAMGKVPPPRCLTCTTSYDHASAQVILEVADTGPGIPPDIVARIFEPFFTTKPSGAGTGLGLSLCKEIVERYGGTIQVQSRPGQGAVFRIALPVDASAMAAPLSHPAEPSVPLQGLAILVVDDESAVASVLAEMLSLDGHQIDIATNGTIALAMLQEQSYDLILSDLRMPEHDGSGLYRELADRHPDLLQHIIFLTGEALSAQAQVFLEQTQVSSVNKPFTLEGLRRAIHQVLQSQNT